MLTMPVSNGYNHILALQVPWGANGAAANGMDDPLMFIDHLFKRIMFSDLSLDQTDPDDAR